MEPIDNKININHVLPLHLVIKSAGSDFYRIGLSLFPFGSQKRNKYHNPCLLMLIHTIFWLKFILSSLIGNDNYKFFLYSGDFPYFWDSNSRHHMNSACEICSVYLL